MTPRTTLTIQFVFIAAALSLMVGCFYLPVEKHPRYGDKLPPDRIGPPGSGKELQLRISTRDDVRNVFGRRLQCSPDNRYALFQYEVKDGYWVLPLCFYADPDYEMKFLLFSFNSDGRLEKSELFDDWQSATLNTGIRRHDPATRPTTAPQP